MQDYNHSANLKPDIVGICIGGGVFVNNKASVGRKTTPVTKKAGKRRPAKKIHVPRTPNSEEHGLVGKVDLVFEMVC